MVDLGMVMLAHRLGDVEFGACEAAGSFLSLTPASDSLSTGADATAAAAATKEALQSLLGNARADALSSAGVLVASRHLLGAAFMYAAFWASVAWFTASAAGLFYWRGTDASSKLKFRLLDAAKRDGNRKTK